MFEKQKNIQYNIEKWICQFYSNFTIKEKRELKLRGSNILYSKCKIGFMTADTILVHRSKKLLYPYFTFTVIISYKIHNILYILVINRFYKQVKFIIILCYHSQCRKSNFVFQAQLFLRNVCNMCIFPAIILWLLKCLLDAIVLVWTPRS